VLLAVRIGDDDVHRLLASSLLQPVLLPGWTSKLFLWRLRANVSIVAGPV